MIEKLMKLFDEVFPLIMISGIFVFSSLLAITIGKINLLLLNLCDACVLIPMVWMIIRRS